MSSSQHRPCPTLPRPTSPARPSPVEARSSPEAALPTTVLFTGFPGFLGSALLPRTLRRSPDAQAVALVQERWLDQARRTLERLEATEPALAGRTRLVVGDITRPGLGLDDEEAAALRSGPLEIFHLAAVYDLSVAPELAWSVNVEGTRNVVDLARGADELVRLQYVSTCYVSGRYPGLFFEDDLELGQRFSNHYEHTKHEAERIVAKAREAGMPVTIYRPSVVVGDSRTGETQKYDGPYYALQLIARQGRVAVMPLPGDPSRVHFNLVPSDFVVDAIAALAPHPGALNRTVALAAPAPADRARHVRGLRRAHRQEAARRARADDALALLDRPPAGRRTAVQAALVDAGLPDPPHRLRRHRDHRAPRRGRRALPDRSPSTSARWWPTTASTRTWAALRWSEGPMV